MPEVIVRKGEPVDRALKRLKNKLDAEGILEEVRRLRAFETPSQKTRRKAKANAKRGRDQVPFQSVVALAAFVGSVRFSDIADTATERRDYSQRVASAKTTPLCRIRRRFGNRDRCTSNWAHWSRGRSHAGC